MTTMPATLAAFDRHAGKDERSYDTAGARTLIKTVEQIATRHGWRPYEAFRRTVELVDCCARSGGRPGPADDEFVRHARAFDDQALTLASRFLADLWTTAWPDGFSDREPPDFRDHLGTAYMAICGSDKFNGQYFTPWPVAKMMALMLQGDPEAETRGRGPDNPVTVCDPAVGSGVMLLAHAASVPWRLVQEGRYAYFGMDSDPTCANMARLNLWCRGIGVVWCGLTEEGRDRFGLDDETIAAAEALAPHGKVPVATIARESARDFAEVGRALTRLDGGGVAAGTAPPAPRTAKAPPRRRG